MLTYECAYKLVVACGFHRIVGSCNSRSRATRSYAHAGAHLEGRELGWLELSDGTEDNKIQSRG